MLLLVAHFIISNFNTIVGKDLPTKTNSLDRESVAGSQKFLPFEVGEADEAPGDFPIIAAKGLTFGVLGGSFSPLLFGDFFGDFTGDFSGDFSV